MEWIIGIIVLYFIFVIDSGTSSSSKRELTDQNKQGKKSSKETKVSPYRKQLDELKKSPPKPIHKNAVKENHSVFDEQDELALISKLRNSPLAEIGTKQPSHQKVIKPSVTQKIANSGNNVTSLKIPGATSSARANSSIFQIVEPNPTIKNKATNSSGVEQIVNAFRLHGITKLWHMTHRDNITTIMDKGILCHSAAHNSFRPTDISFESVQHWRTRIDPINKKPLHNYAPTYLNIRNPMLYVKRDINRDLCLIEISLSVLYESQFVFTDGNAAAKNTRFFNSSLDVHGLPWDVLKAEYWNDYIDGKRKRCAEVLIYPLIKPEYISRVYCCSDDTLRYLHSIGCDAVRSERFFY